MLREPSSFPRHLGCGVLLLFFPCLLYCSICLFGLVGGPSWLCRKYLLRALLVDVLTVRASGIFHRPILSGVNVLSPLVPPHPSFSLSRARARVLFISCGSSYNISWLRSVLTKGSYRDIGSNANERILCHAVDEVSILGPAVLAGACAT